jgi:hypothetical protein
MHSMAALPSAMLVRPDARFGDLRGGGGGGGRAWRAPGVALRASRVQFAVRREVRVRAGALVAYRSAFLARALVVDRRLDVFGHGAIGGNRRSSFVVRAAAAGAGQGFGEVEEDVGSEGVLEEKADWSFGSEVAAEAGRDDLVTVEEIEVPGPSGFSDGSVASFEDAELETDVVHQSTRQQPELVKFLRKVWRALQGLKEKEDAVLELSSSMKEKKLRWNPLGFLNGSTPSATEKLRNKVFDGLRRAEDDFFTVRSGACSALLVCNRTCHFRYKGTRCFDLPSQTLFYGKFHCVLPLPFLIFILITSSAHKGWNDFLLNIIS